MIKICIVEDEEPIANLIRMSLTKYGYSCTCVYDGLEAANLLEKERFDLLLLDIMLPGADGYELLEYSKYLDIPTIFITAKNALEDRVKGLKMGAEDYIVKPFEIVELLARMGVEVFPASVYGLAAIPHRLIVSDIFWVVGLVFVFGLLASFIPALCASLKDPVRALNQ